MIKKSLLLLILVIFTRLSYSQRIHNINHYANGNKRTEWYVDKKTNKLDGVAKSFYSNGIIYTVKHWSQGVLNDTAYMYHRNGRISAKVPFVNNKQEGLSTFWHENGVIAQTINYKNNLKEGEVKSFYSNGKIKSITSYHNNLQYGVSKSWHENGCQREIGNWLNGKANGYFVGYDKECRRVIEGHFINNLKQGLETRYIYNSKDKKPQVVKKNFKDNKVIYEGT